MFLRVDYAASVRSDMAVLDPTVGRYLSKEYFPIMQLTKQHCHEPSVTYQHAD